MAEKTAHLRTQLMRLLLTMVVGLVLLSAVVHIAVQRLLDEHLRAPLPGRLFELLTMQTWLQAALIGVLLVLVSYFVMLPLVRKMEQRSRDLAKAEAQLDHSLRHDSLTGLPDRHFLDELIAHSLARGQRHGHAVGLLRLDLDGFRAANARLGAEACDKILTKVAYQLRATARASDYVARVSGDEFVVLVPEFKSVEGLGAFAKRLMEELADTEGGEKSEESLTCSIGIAAAWPNDQMAPHVLMQRADEALTDAQAEGGNTWRYHPSAIQKMEGRLTVAG